MHRILTTAVAFLAASLLAACSSSEPLDFEPPPGQDTDPAPAQLSPALENALREMDCAEVTLTTPPDTSGVESGEDQDEGEVQQAGIEIREAGHCIPFAGVEQVDFFEFASADDARTWASSDAVEIAGVDNAYISGAVIIIDRNNDYLMQLTMQFDSVS